MPPQIPIVVLEVGTTRTVCMVGMVDDEGSVTVTGLGTSATTGVRKGEITELNYAISSIRTAVEAASDAARCDIRSACLIYSGGSTESTHSVGRVTLPPRHQLIDIETIQEVRDLARYCNLPPDTERLHSIVCNYVIDDMRVVHNPEGLTANQLQVNMLSIHTSTSGLTAMSNAVEEAQVEILSCKFSALCAGAGVLTAEQKRAGVLLVDLGGGTTSYLAYANETYAAAGSFAVGGDHVTNDISQGFHLTSVKTAEWLKISSSSAILDKATPTERGTIPAHATLGAPERSYNLRSLHTIVNARLEEAFKILRTIMDSHNILSKFGAGVVLTGGGAYQDGIVPLVQRIFQCPCVIGTLDDPELAQTEQSAALASAYGGLKLAALDELRKSRERPSWLSRIFSKGT